MKQISPNPHVQAGPPMLQQISRYFQLDNGIGMFLADQQLPDLNTAAEWQESEPA